MKLTYKNSEQKKKVRDFIFSQFKDKQIRKIVGLAGPDVEDYISYLKSKGYDDFVIYENHAPTMFKQLRYLTKLNNVQLKYEDVFHAENKDDVIYDLDYCSTVKFMKNHLKKFTQNFIMTFSLRIGEQETVKKFFKDRKEQIISITDNFSSFFPVAHKLYTTTNGQYIYVKYFDTSTMCCFAKIN